LSFALKQGNGHRNRDMSNQTPSSKPTGELVSASLRNDGLLELRVGDGFHGTLPAIKEVISFIGKAAGDKAYPLLVISSKDSSIDTESMEYVAKKEADPHSTAVAFLISSISQKLLGNFYLSFNKPEKPTKIFTNLDEAVKWLHGFRQ
jgi:hypothetical protein